ncbi:hypothetical protein M885DRAFT_19101 [Pelagophyceae sp. CCMP2097]|nr:hypothetical protein M885DRAFT_19101 [Pelagophyceae sp. CCMP2097]
MGPLVLQCRQGDVVDVGAIIKAAEEQFGVAKVIEVDCEENRGLAGAFSDLSTFNFKNGDTMKGVAFKKVFEALQKHTEPITSGKQAQKLANIGKSSGTKIDEFLSTGRMEALEQFKNAV